MRTLTPGARLDRTPRIVIEDRCAPAILERIIREAGPFLRRTAASIAEDFPAVVSDLVQEARITLWQLDLGRVHQNELTLLQRMLCTRMIDVYRHECRHGFTTGWSKHVRKP